MNNSKKLIAVITVFAFIFTQSGIGAGVAYAAAGKQQNLRRIAVPQATGDGSAAAIGGALKNTTAGSAFSYAGAVGDKDAVYKRIEKQTLPEYDAKAIDKAALPYLDTSTGEIKEMSQDELSKIVADSMRESAERLSRVEVPPPFKTRAQYNAMMIAGECLDNGTDFSGARSGRATTTDAASLANSYLIESDALRSVIHSLGNIAQARFGFTSNTKLIEHDTDMSLLAPEIQQFFILLQDDEIPDAQIIGAIEDFNKAADNVLAEVRHIYDESMTELAPQIAKAKDSKKHKKGAKEEKRLKKDLQNAEDLIRKAKKQVLNVRTEFYRKENKDKRRHGDYVMQLARLSTTGAWAVWLLNKQIDPHFAGAVDPEVLAAAKEAKDRSHATPYWDQYLEWLTDIIESAPAYAAYNILGTEAGGEKIDLYLQRSAMMELYRSYAAKMARNVEHTIASECVTLAREFLFRHVLKKDAKSDKEILKEIKKLVKSKVITEADIANVAMIIWKDYFSGLRGASLEAAQVKKYHSDRVEIMRGLLYQEGSEAEEFARLRNAATSLEGIRSAAEETLSDRTVDYMKEEMGFFALKPQRDMPCIHMSTTMGPNETETLTFFLEEAIQLHLVSRANNLEDEVTRRAQAYKDRYKAIKKRFEDELTFEEGSYAMETEINRLFLLLNIFRPVSDKNVKVENLNDDIAFVDSQVEAWLKQNIRGKGFDRLKERLTAEAKRLVRRQTVGAAKDLNINALIDADIKRRLREEYMLRRNLHVDEETLGKVGPVADYFVQKEILGDTKYAKDMNNPNLKYTASGYMPDVYVIYAPSRFDMGEEQWRSVVYLGKMLAANHPKAYQRALKLYRRYNRRPVAFRDYRIAEEGKPGENFYSRGVPTYVSMGAADILRSFGIGSYEEQRELWNSRGDRLMLPATVYPGYCVPKEFALLLAGVLLRNDPKGFDKLLDSFGILMNKKVRDRFKRDCQRLLDGLPPCPSREQIIAAGKEIFADKYKEYTNLLEDITEENYPDIVDRYLAQQQNQNSRIYGFLPALLLAYDTGVIKQQWSGGAQQLTDKLAFIDSRALLETEEINRLSQFRTILSIYTACRLKWEKDAELRRLFECPEGKKSPKDKEKYEEKFREWFGTLKMMTDLTYKPNAEDTRNSPAARLLDTLSGITLMHYYEVNKEKRDWILETWKTVFGDFTSPTLAGIRVVSPVGPSGLWDAFPQAHTDENLRGFIEGNPDKGIAGFLPGLIKRGLTADWIREQADEHGIAYMEWDWQGVGKTTAWAKKYFSNPEAEMCLVPYVFGDKRYMPHAIAQKVQEFLVRKGVMEIDGHTVNIWGEDPDTAIKTNIIAFDGDMREWPQLKERKEDSDKQRAYKRSIIKGIGPAIHYVEALNKTYSEHQIEDAITGVDIIDIGIPGPGLLKLLRNMPKLLRSADTERRKSAHIFIGGSSAARLPAFDYVSIEEEVTRLLFAYDPLAVYVPLSTALEGGSRGEGVEAWRREAIEEKEKAEIFYNAVMNRDAQAAYKAFDDLAGHMRLWDLAEHYNKLTKTVRKNNLPIETVNYFSQKSAAFLGFQDGSISLTDTKKSRVLNSSDFMLSLGNLLLEGKYPADELNQRLDDFDTNIKMMQKKLKTIIKENEKSAEASATGKEGRQSLYTAAVPNESSRRGLVLGTTSPRPGREMSPMERAGDVVLAASLKDLLESGGPEQGGYVERQEAKRAKKEEKEKIDAFKETLKNYGVDLSKAKSPEQILFPIENIYSKALDIIGKPSSVDKDYRITNRQYGEFLAYLTLAWMRLLNDVTVDNKKLQKEAFKVFCENINGESFSRDKFAQAVRMLGKIADHCHDSKQDLSLMSRVAEMVNIAYVIEEVIRYDAFNASATAGTERNTWAALGDFFDASVGTRTYDYEAYFMDRVNTRAFQGLSRDEIFKRNRRYTEGWLFGFVRWMIEHHTEYALQPQEYTQAWLGNWHEDNGRIIVDKNGVGVTGETEDQKFWFTYRRMFDAAQAARQGQAIPILITDADPANMGFAGAGMHNTGIWYPILQHAQRAVHDAASLLAKYGINVFTCEDINMLDSGAGKSVVTRAAYTKADRNRARKLLKAAGYSPEKLTAAVADIKDSYGAPVAISFVQDVILESVWFHAFNVLRAVVDEADAYLIQPIIWETMCYLKDFFGQMYEGIAPAPPQREVHMDLKTIGSKYGGLEKMPAQLREYLEAHPETYPLKRTAKQTRKEVEKAILGLVSPEGEREVRLYEPVSFGKPTIESGGRGMQEFVIYDKDGNLLEKNLKKAVKHGMEVLGVDHLVLQAGLPSYPSDLLSQKALKRFRELMAVERSTGVNEATPKYNYRRDIVVLLTASETQIPPKAYSETFKELFEVVPDMARRILEVPGPDGKFYYYAISHEMDIVSTDPIGNAAIKGRVLRHFPDNIAEKYSKDFEFARKESDIRSLQAQLKFIRENWRKILAHRMTHSAELGNDPDMLKYLSMEEKDLPASAFLLPYEMGDYMVEWLIDEHDRIVSVYNYENAEFIPVFDKKTGKPTGRIKTFYDKDGNEAGLERNLYDENNKQRVLYFKNPVELKAENKDPELYRVRAMVHDKVESNAGKGLWQPYAVEEARFGERGMAAFIVFYSFGRWWQDMYNKPVGQEKAAAGQKASKTKSTPKVYIPVVNKKAVLQRAQDAAVAQLGIEKDKGKFTFAPEEISVVLSYWMYFTGKRTVEKEDVASLLEIIPVDDAELLDELLTSEQRQDYRDFIANQIAAEMEAAAESVASPSYMPPALRISPHVLTEAQAQDIFGADRNNIGIVFNNSYTVNQRAIAQLQADADKAVGPEKINVLGIPMQNLIGRKDGSSDIILFAQDNEPVLYFLSKGVKPGLIRPVNLISNSGESELALHQKLAKLAKMHKILITSDENYAGLISDKDKMFEKLEASSPPAMVKIPNRLVMASLDEKEFSKFLRAVAKEQDENTADVVVYLQPNNEGTEGRDTKAFTIRLERKSPASEFKLDKGADSEFRQALKHASHILGAGSAVLIRPEEGNLFYSDGNSPEEVEIDHRRISWRVNAGSSTYRDAKDAQYTFARTGFAMVAKDTDSFVTSVEQGGTINDINEAWYTKAWYRDINGNWQRFRPNQQDTHVLCDTSAWLAQALRQGLCGPDPVVKVNPDNGRLQHIVPLDTNSRGVLRPATEILFTDKLPSDYKSEEHLMIAPAEFWQMVLASSAAANSGGMNCDIELMNAIYPEAIAPEKLLQWQKWFDMARKVLDPQAETLLGWAPSRAAMPLGGRHADYIGFMGGSLGFPIVEGLGEFVQITDGLNGNVEVYCLDSPSDEVMAAYKGGPRVFNINAGWINGTFEIKDDEGNIVAMNPAGITTLSEWDKWAAKATEERLRNRPDKKMNYADDLLAAVFAFLQTPLGDPTGKARETIQQLKAANKGLKVAIVSDSLPGGQSTSSTIVIALAKVLNEKFGWGMDNMQLAGIGYCERIWSGTQGGIKDHATFMNPPAFLGVAPVRIISDINVPQDIRLISMDTGISRDAAARLSDKMKQPGNTELNIKSRTGIGYALSMLWLRKHFKDADIENILFPDYVDEATTKTNKYGFGRELLTAFTPSELLNILRAIPEKGLSRQELLDDLPEYADMLNELFAKDTTLGPDLSQPVYHLREMLQFGLTEEARSMVTVDILKQLELGETTEDTAFGNLLDIARAAHNADRVTKYDVVMDANGRVLDVRKTGWNPFTSDAMLDAQIARGEDFTLPDFALGKAGYGNLERSLEPIDMMVDLIEAFNQYKGGNAAAGVIVGGGLGGTITCLVADQDYVTELNEFLEKEYYQRLNLSHKSSTVNMLSNPAVAAEVSIVESSAAGANVTGVVSMQKAAATVVAAETTTTAGTSSTSITVNFGDVPASKTTNLRYAAIVVGEPSEIDQIELVVNLRIELGEDNVKEAVSAEQANRMFQQLKASYDRVFVINRTGEDMTGQIEDSLGQIVFIDGTKEFNEIELDIKNIGTQV